MEFLKIIVGVLMGFGSFLHGAITPDVLPPVVQYVPEYIEVVKEVPSAGAIVPSAVALYTDSLANAISSSDTSFTLVRGTDKTGTALASSTYGFIIDEGSANEEMVLANCTGTVCTNATRGINPVSGTSTTASLQKSHRRGATVKMTDGPILITLSQIARGREGYGAIIKYDTSVGTSSFSNANEIINKGYADYLAFNGAGVLSATESAMGVSEIATASEVASGTTSGTSGRLVIPASQASSTRGLNAGQGVVVATDANGTIDDDFLPRTIATSTTFSATTTFSGVVNFTATTTGTLGSSTLKVFSVTGSSTYSKPNFLKHIIVEIIGGGGGGGPTAGGTSGNAGNGGGAGGYVKKFVLAGNLASSTNIYTGAGGGESTAGTYSLFGGIATSTGGAGGTGSVFGAGGVGSGGDLNGVGSSGGSEGSDSQQGGSGGGGMYGYGYGGKGGYYNGIGGASGGNGVVIVTEYY